MDRVHLAYLLIFILVAALAVGLALLWYGSHHQTYRRALKRERLRYSAEDAADDI